MATNTPNLGLVKPELQDNFNLKLHLNDNWDKIDEACGNPETVTAQGADMAEVGEWADGNPNNEERLYRFVSIAGSTGKEIQLATSSTQIVGTSNNIENVGFLGGYTKGDEDDPSKVIVSLLGVAPVITYDKSIVADDRVMSDDEGYAVKSTNNLGYRVINIEAVTPKYNVINIVVSPNTDLIQRIKTDMSILSDSMSSFDDKISQVNKNVDNIFVKKELLVNLSSFKDESGDYKNVGRYYYNSADKVVGISNDSNYACIPIELKAGMYSVQNINPYYSFYVIDNTVIRLGEAGNSAISTILELPIDTTLYVTIKIDTTVTGYETVAIASGDTIPDDISTLGVFSYDTPMKLDSVKKLEEKIPSVLTVKKDGTGDFSTLKEAVDYSRSHSDLTIEVYGGTYDLIEEFGEEYFANLTNISQRQGLQIGNGVHLIFSSGSKVVCHYEGDNEAVKTCFSPFNFAQGTKGFTLENLTLEASNVRYAIHDEGGSHNTPNMYRNIYRNCKITIDNSNNEPWKKHTCIGGGLGLQGEIIVENCCFTDMYDVGAKVSTVSYHNAVTEGAKSKIVVTGCYFSDNTTFRLSYYGNSTEITEAYVSNCSMTCEPYVSAESSAYTTENVKLIMWNNEIRNS